MLTMLVIVGMIGCWNPRVGFLLLIFVALDLLIH